MLNFEIVLLMNNFIREQVFYISNESRSFKSTQSIPNLN